VERKPLSPKSAAMKEVFKKFKEMCIVKSDKIKKLAGREAEE